MTDMHVCPMVTPGTPPVPHVGGPILPPCVPTVLIGMLPAATVGDMCVCVGPPDTIAMGSPTVYIGGKMAARMGDPTTHGGMITMGCPTVIIGESGSGGASGAGGGGFGNTENLLGIAIAVAVVVGVVILVVVSQSDTEKYSDGITLKGDKAYRDAMRKHLDALKATPTGKKIIDELDRQGRAGKGVTIKHDKGEDPGCSASSDRFAAATSVDPATGKMKVDTPGKGTSSVIDFPADFSEHPDLQNYADGSPGPPLAVPLGHEMIHAVHNGDGTNLRKEVYTGDPIVPTSNHEEAQTMGIGPYSGDPMTENALRNDFGHGTPRTSHGKYP